MQNLLELSTSYPQNNSNENIPPSCESYDAIALRKGTVYILQFVCKIQKSDVENALKRLVINFKKSLQLSYQRKIIH